MEEVKVEIETNGVLDSHNHEEENQHTTDIKEQEDEDGEEESADNIEFNCSFCEEQYKQPKILSCLHIFCLDCVKKIVDTSLEGKEEDATLKSKGGKILINCPTCHQITNVSSIDTLPTDYITMNMLELLAIKDKKVVCTSCKSQQPAVARCSDCANFLCPICVNAHQYMRCFENHKVNFAFLIILIYFRACCTCK
jgi:tripartite motif-containing protein 2/3